MIRKLLRHEIAWSTVVQLLGKLGQVALGYFTVKLLTGALGAEQYGIYGKIMEFSLFFSTAGNLGIFGNTVRRLSEKPDDSNLFWNALLLRLTTGFFVFGLGLLFALTQTDSSTFWTGSALLMGSLLLDDVTSVCTGALQADYRMGRSTLAMLAGRAVNLAVIFGLFHSGNVSIPLYLIAPVLGSLLTVGLSLAFVSERIALKGRWNSRLQKDLLWTSLPFGIINLMNSVTLRFLPSALLAGFLTDATYSTYSLSLHLSSTASLLSTLLMFSVLPALKHALTEGHWQTARELYRKAGKVLTVCALLLMVGGTLLGPWALRLVSGAGFLKPELSLFLPLLLLIAAASYFYDLTFLTLFALNQDTWWLKRQSAALGLNLILSLASLLLPTDTLKILGILGASLLVEVLLSWHGHRKILSLSTENLLKRVHVGV